MATTNHKSKLLKANYITHILIHSLKPYSTHSLLMKMNNNFRSKQNYNIPFHQAMIKAAYKNLLSNCLDSIVLDRANFKQ